MPAMSNGATASTSQQLSSGNKKPALSKTTFHLLAGLASGFTSAVLLQPADLLKTRVQQSRSSSLLQTLKTILAAEHPVRQLWRGTLPSTIRTSVGSALYFTTLNALRTNLATVTAVDNASKTLLTSSATSSALPRLSATANLLSGAVARASVGFIMMPITVIKVRYESSLYSQYHSLGGAARAIWAQEGVKGFFAGFGATAIRDAPYAGLYVLFYEQGNRALAELAGRAGGDTNKNLKGSTSAGINFASGALAAALATAATNPPDAIKTRLQLRPNKYRNTLQAARVMLAEEGVRSMFDGLGLRVARKALSSALAWTVYEEVVRRAQVKLVDAGR